MKVMEKERHLRALSNIDLGIKAAEQITIEDGIKEAIAAGRMTEQEGQMCLEAYERTFHGGTVVELHPEYPDGAA